jgi:hypothetical protein
MYGIYTTAFALLGSNGPELWSHGRAVGVLPTLLTIVSVEGCCWSSRGHDDESVHSERLREYCTVAPISWHSCQWHRGRTGAWIEG